ncbi:hypothetical protein AC579_3001 [Pseudocercospora musae]|uniref:Leucine-rich repeat-containing protein n=1 Tax=Pseudocercospora musae TaxID=113226 RepID=A0A139I5B7_9PEZI|nr:hypothetical protein AC579_3001 [Pseudocercospora musae]
MDSEDGKLFVKNLAYFVRTHERALANALQSQRQNARNGKDQATAGATSSSAPTTTISLAEALSRPYLSFSTSNIRPSKLTLTPHHLYYLLTRFEHVLSMDPGAMDVRFENLDAEPIYMSFLNAPRSRGKQSDADSLRSVSSVRSVMSSVSSVWSSLTGSNSAAKAEKQKTQYGDDLKYLYSCFTKIPALRLSRDDRARRIAGYEEFPFDTCVPLFVFKNVSSLEICDLDFRTFHGWDRLAEQLRSLTIRNASLEDPIELLRDIVLDDAEKRRKRSSKTQVPTTPSTPGLPWPLSASPKPSPSNNVKPLQIRRASAASPMALARGGSSDGIAGRQSSNSPPRPSTSRHASLHKSHANRGGIPAYRRSSGSSGSSQHEMSPRHSASDLLAMGILPSTKWRFLRHLSVAENGLTYLSVSSLAPVASTLQSLDLSGNLFTEVPDALASLTHLRALNLSNCMINSLSSLSRSPLPAITTLNLRSNRLLSLAGIERLYSLERLDLRDNKLHDPTELARLTGIPDIADLYVVRNPFTRTHSNYRVVAFNLFRSSPGHVQDPTIDTMGPLYHEKKYLVDRVPEPANKPVVRPPPEEEEARLVREVADAGLEPVPKPPTEPSRHRRSASDMGPQSTVRRKKTPRRRVVELAQADQRAANFADVPSEPSVPELIELPPMPHTPTTESDQPTTPEATPYHTATPSQLPQTPLAVHPSLDTALASPTPPPKIRDSDDDDNSPVRSPDDLGPNTDVYRQKIEALKNELGPNWLSALNEQRLEEPQTRTRSFSPASRTSTVRPEHTGRGVSVGGRTLG